MRTEPFVIDVTVTRFISGIICAPPPDAQILHLLGAGESIGGGAGPTRGTGNSNTVQASIIVIRLRASSLGPSILVVQFLKFL